MGLMTIDDTPQMIEFVLSEEDLLWIRDEYDILESIKFELLGPFDRVTIGLVN